MKFCKHCGNELSDGVKFCNHCGQKLTDSKEPKKEVTEEPKEQVTEEQQPVQEQVTKTNENTSNQSGGLGAKPTQQGGLGQQSNTPKQGPKLTKQTKLIMVIAGALIILLFAAYQVGASLTAPEKMIEKFETAMHEQDADKVADLLTSSSKNLTIDDKTVAGFIEYYHGNPSEMDYLIQHLKDQLLYLENNPDEDVTGTDYYYAVNLEKDGKTLVFDNYDLIVSPVYFTVYTNYEDTEIYLGDEVVATADKPEFTKEIGPFLPGTYNFKAVYNSDFVELTTEVERTNFDPGYVTDVNLYLDGEEVTFELPYDHGFESVKLYLNGEDSGLNLIEDNHVGPLLIDGSMTAAFETEFPWGAVKTDEVPIESYYVTVEFDANDELKQTIKDTIVTFNQEYLAAVTTADASKLTVADENVIDDVISSAEYDKEWDYYYQGKFNGIDFDGNSFYLSNYDGEWSVDVNTITYYEEDSYYDDEEPELEETEEEIAYELAYRDGTWIVTYTGWAGYMDGTNMIEYRAEDAQVFTSEWAN